jgi:ribosomal protein S25
VSRRVITISRKRWGKSAAKTERIIRDAVPKPDTQTGIEEYLKKAKSVTCYDLANRFNIRMSIARKILREKEVEGVVVPYIREGGFVVYTTASELAKREGGAPIMVADALEEVASSVPKKPVITDEMDIALAAASRPELVKPSRLTRKRREAGAKKERKDLRPEVVVEPLATVEPQPEPVEVQKKTPKKKAAPKKKPTKKKEAKKKPAPKKVTKKKVAEKKPAPKKVTKKKAAEKKPAPKKVTKKKEAEKKPAPKKVTKKKEAEKKPAAKKTTKKKEAKKPAPKKTTKKKAEEKAAPKKTTKKK